MSDASATEAYNGLVEWLRHNDLQWVALQIEQEIILGKIKSERIRVPASILSRDTPYLIEKVSAEPTTGEFVARVEYTAQEKFDIAAGAIEAGVLGAIKIQDALAKTLNAERSDIEIHFVPGETGGIEHTYRPTELVAAKDKIEEIERYFRELRSDVKNDD